ncbi:MAG: hypothetical protein AAFZ52_17045 [Bacteroidota bacterium]
MPLAQTLTIRFTRKAPQRTIFTVLRADGTTTWMVLYPGTEAHDLAHYMVESVLELDNAFFGLLAQGHDISDFELPPDQRPDALRPVNLPQESLQVEHLVNLLLTELSDQQLLTDFQEQLRQILVAADLPELLILTSAKLAEIRVGLRSILTEWRAVVVGETLELRLA